MDAAHHVGRRQAAADQLRVGESVALVTPWEEPIGILHLEERFPYDGREEARLVYGTNDPRHPGARYQLNRGEILLAGPVDLIARPPLKGFEAYRLDPAAARQRFQQLGWRTVVGFQSQQPMHRAHEYIQKCALEPLDGLFIHPRRPDQAGRGAVRSAGPLLSGAGRAVLPEDRASCSPPSRAPCATRPPGNGLPRSVRKNYGCTHFIVGREYAGVESAFAPITVDQIFQAFAPDELGIVPLFFDETSTAAAVRP